MFTPILPILLLLEVVGLILFSLVMRAFDFTITTNDYIVLISAPFATLLLALSIGFFAYRIKIKLYNLRG